MEQLNRPMDPLVNTNVTYTKNDLEKFHISITPVDTIKDFFGIDTLPQPTFAEPVYSEILTLTNPNETENVLPWRIISDLKLLHTGGPQPPTTDLVSLIALHLLQLIDYEGPKGRLTCLSGKITVPSGIVNTGPFLIDSETGAHLLFVEGHRRRIVQDAQPRDPIEHLITDALAAFQSNNKWLKDSPDRKPLEKATIPGVIFNGSFPTLYLIPVTQELIEAMAENRTPAHETKVLAYTPDIPEPLRSEGFWAVENRLLILQIFEAFKPFVSKGLNAKE